LPFFRLLWWINKNFWIKISFFVVYIDIVVIPFYHYNVLKSSWHDILYVTPFVLGYCWHYYFLIKFSHLNEGTYFSFNWLVGDSVNNKDLCFHYPKKTLLLQTCSVDMLSKYYILFENQIQILFISGNGTGKILLQFEFEILKRSGKERVAAMSSV